MKKRILSIVVLAAMTVVPMGVFAQNTDTESAVSAAAKIITPITLAKSGTLDFGSIATTTAGGIVTRNLAGRTSTGTNDLVPQFPGSVPTMTVEGQADYTYTITLPANGIVTLSGPGTAMPVNDFIAENGGVVTGGTLTSGEDEFTIGAKLTVGANQTAGNYTGSFAVTVAYN